MDEVIPGILHWKARHPNLGADVSSYLLTDTGTALDPMLPENSELSPDHPFGLLGSVDVM